MNICMCARMAHAETSLHIVRVQLEYFHSISPIYCLISPFCSARSSVCLCSIISSILSVRGSKIPQSHMTMYVLFNASHRLHIASCHKTHRSGLFCLCSSEQYPHVLSYRMIIQPGDNDVVLRDFQDIQPFPPEITQSQVEETHRQIPTCHI